MKNTIITVKLWGLEVGKLLWDDRKSNSIFEFNREFLKHNLNVAPLIHSITDVASMRPIWGTKERLYQALPPFIADSLPDNWGNKVFEQWANENNIRGHNLTPLEKLAYIGKRGMGAFEFEPEFGREDTKEDIQIKELAALAEKIYKQREDETVLQDENLTLQALFRIGTSAGGRQAKAIIAINETTGEIRSGQVIHEEGFEYYILKFDMDFDFGHPATRLEMVYYQMAKAAGVIMMPSRLLELEGRRHFLTQRYDRKDSQKIHKQSLAAMNPFADSYEDLFTTCRRLNIDRSERIALYRQMVFNFLAGNTDDHNKNFEFLMGKDGVWHLAPAYDITFTQCSPHGRSSHCLTLKGKADNVTVEEMVEFGLDEGIPSPAKIVSQVAEAVTKFREHCSENGIFGFWVDFIEEELARLAPEDCKEALMGWKENRISEYQQDGMLVKNLRFEPVEKGNVHLYAEIGGRNLKYIFRDDTMEAVRLLSTEPGASSEEYLKELAAKYLIPKAAR
jgi:serine/threonine-protein kinase HipA